jgi:hypothetical protein
MPYPSLSSGRRWSIIRPEYAWLAGAGLRTVAAVGTRAITASRVGA